MNNVIDLGDVETSSGNIGTDKDTSFAVDEFEECRSTLLLFLLAVDRKNLKLSETVGVEVVDGNYRKIDIVQ